MFQHYTNGAFLTNLRTCCGGNNNSNNKNATSSYVAAEVLSLKDYLALIDG